jgi:phosphatidylglycerophosphate synthase
VPKNGARVVTAAASVALLAWLICRIGPAQLRQDLTRLGWGLVLVIALGGLPHVIRTWAWRFTLPTGPKPSFARMLSLRLGSEAIAQLGFLGTVLGDAMRVSLFDANIESTSVIASVALDRALFILAANLVTALGAVIALLFLPLPHHVAMLAGGCALVVVLAIIAAMLAIGKRVRFLSGTARAASRIPRLGQWTAKRLSAIQSVERLLLDFFHCRPQAFRAGLLLNLACHLVAVLEAWLVLHLLGVHIGLAGAFAVEALTKLINGLGGFNPGNIGTYEGGNMLIGKLLRFGGATGIALAFARRARAVFWGSVGAVCLAFASKRRGIQHVSDHGELADPTLAAVILVDRPMIWFRTASRLLPRVGEVPVLLRTILGLRKAGFGRIIVATSPQLLAPIESELRRTDRLPDIVEWFATSGPQGALVGLIENLASNGVLRVAFVTGDRTHQPALLRTLAEWSSQRRGLSLRTRENQAGACVLPVSSARAFAGCVNGEEELAGQLHTWSFNEWTLATVNAPDYLWQRIQTEQDRIAAERKLDAWLVKPTDGVFARFNRKISIPISRQLIRFPVTPNMVSIFTLGVSFLSGILFAMGGYLNMLGGAVVGLFASILDGCDGEVARLKLQESAFGCWLETVCDYLYYLFMFAGMTIGLLRSSGKDVYLYLGCVLVFGAVMSFVATAMQRRRLADARRPEQLLRNWQNEAERRKSNPLLYLARHTEFVVRRCFLPYAILFFAAFQIVPAAFLLAAVGANVVWPIALYSYWTFPAASTQRATA